MPHPDTEKLAFVVRMRRFYWKLSHLHRHITEPIGGWLTTRYQRDDSENGKRWWAVGWRLRYHAWPYDIPEGKVRCR